MKSRKHSRIKRHPIVRFIRGIFRLFRVISRSKKSFSTTEYHQKFTEESLQLEPEPVKETAFVKEAAPVAYNRANLITVGELFSQVNWQLPAASPETVTKIQVHDVSRN